MHTSHHRVRDVNGRAQQTEVETLLIVFAFPADIFRQNSLGQVDEDVQGARDFFDSLRELSTSCPIFLGLVHVTMRDPHPTLGVLVDVVAGASTSVSETTNSDL